MKILQKHLLSRINKELKIESLSDSLFQLGHEHEIDNNLLNMELTPNRGDCLSVLGLLRDLNSIHDANLEFDIFNKEIKKLELDFVNNVPNACPEISFLKIEIVENSINEYCDYLEEYFLNTKASKNNFFADVSNYISYELGQPTHCYDFLKIDGELVLDKINESKEFLTLLDTKIKLTGTNYVFSDSTGIVNLAGIMGGKSTSCNKKTNIALIECAYFLPEILIGKSIKYDLNSDAAYKFERGVDPLSHNFVLRRFIQIVKDHAQIKNLEISLSDGKSFIPHHIEIDVNKINSILAINLTEQKYLNHLHKLGFKIKNQIEAPSHRNDIHNHNDLSEEIARVIGYNNLPVSKINLPNAKFTSSTKLEYSIKDFLVSHGFHEVINSPFTKNNLGNAVTVDNPLDSNRKYLRTNINESLLNNLNFNEKRQKESIKLFEITDIYTKDDLSGSSKILGIIASGRQGDNFEDFSKKIDKNYLESILYNLSKKTDFNVTEVSRENIDTKIKRPIFFVEIDLKSIANDVEIKEIKSMPLFKSYKYTPISEYPSSYRDLSFMLRDKAKIKTLETLLLNYNNKYLKSCFVFDYFENSKLNEIKIGFRFIFQSINKTLTDDDISIIFKDVVKLSLSIEGVEIPGLKQ